MLIERARAARAIAAAVAVLALLSGFVCGCGQQYESNRGGGVARETTAPRRQTAPRAVEPPVRRAQGLPLQGLYDSANLTTEESRLHLDRMAAAGFKLVLNYGVFGYEAAEMRRYADHAAGVDMQVIWDISSRAFADGTFSRDYVRERVDAVRDHPATWGYYIADEPQEWDMPYAPGLSEYIRSLDPGHPRMLVHWYEEGDPVRTLRPWVGHVDAIALDPYATAGGYPSDRVAVATKAGQAFADANDKKWGVVLQAFDGSQYPEDNLEPGWPGRARMKSERDMVLENSDPAFILWYSFKDIMRSPDPDAWWNDLCAAAFGPFP